MHRIRRRATAASRAESVNPFICFPRPKHRDTLNRENGGENPPQEPDLSIVGQLRTTLIKWLNVLLVFVPAGIATHYIGVNPTVVFVLNFIAVIPLAGLLSGGTEEIALHSGEVIGGLLNATFGNAVELIVSILALVKHEIVIVQTSLIGSILSNLLLVLGMAFIAGGINRPRQLFNKTVGQTAASLLTVCCASLIVPTAFHMASPVGDVGITELSRGTSVILLVVYASYLVFQLKTHSDLYSTQSEKTPTENLLHSSSSKDKIATNGQTALPTPTTPSELPPTPPEISPPPSAITTRQSTITQIHTNGNSTVAPIDDEEDPEVPQLTFWFAIGLLVTSTVLVALCAEGLVSSIDHLVSSSGVSRVFIGLILLPIVGNAAEHATAVTVAIKDKMDLSIGVAVGSSMQIALLVIPLIVILGWILGIDEMNLYFDGFQVMILFVSVLLVNYLIQDGNSNYLEGNLLVALYLIIALASWFYPSDGPLASPTGAKGG